MSSSIANSTEENIAHAAELLRAGKLVAIPTETVYGLAGNALSDSAVAEIYAAKGRPSFNPLIVHVSDAAHAKQYVTFNAVAEQLAEKFWPGPLTLVLKRKDDCPLSLLLSAGLDTVAIRSPNHTIAQALLKISGLPLAAPSANRSGRVSPTRAEHVAEELGNKVAMILDGGACEVGIESTVVDCTGDAPVILRAGAVTAEELNYSVMPHLLRHPVVTYAETMETMNRQTPQQVRGDKFKSPGQLASHYAPSIPVRLDAISAKPEEALLAFGAHVPAGAKHMLNLSKLGDLKEAAANLFAMLRALDTPEFSAIAVMKIPETELGVAINDRLRRAATR